MIRTEITGAEIAEEMEKERRLFQLHMCEVTVPLYRQLALITATITRTRKRYRMRWEIKECRWFGFAPNNLSLMT